MKIDTIEIYKLRIPFVHPIKASIGQIEEADNIAIKITTDSGLVGWGEVSPFAPVTGESLESAFVTAQQLAGLLKGKDPLAIDARVKDMAAFTRGASSTRSGFDIALYDIAAKAAGMPLYRFLGGERREIRTDLTIGLLDSPEETASRAREIRDAGFNAIKLKTGRPGLEDVAHVQALREAVGPHVKIKVDANQGWDYPTAVANINAMEKYDLEYAEQPLVVWDIEGMARLRAKVNMPICADESVFDDKDAFTLIHQGAVDYLNIKLGKSAGIHTGLRINAIAQAAGCKCMIGCYGESRLGLSAAAHLAMARPNIHFIDLDSAYEFKSDPVIGGMRYDQSIGGLIHLSDEPGHGAAFDEAQLDQASRIVI